MRSCPADITVLEAGGPSLDNFNVRAVDGNNRLGGDDLDHALVQHGMEKFEEETGLDARGVVVAVAATPSDVCTLNHSIRDSITFHTLAWSECAESSESFRFQCNAMATRKA